MKISRATRILTALLILSILLVTIFSAIIIFNWSEGDLVQVQSDSMENPGSRSINKDDFVEIDRSSRGIISYSEGSSRDYRVAGSYGDVIVYHPNGDESKTPIIHRAVIFIEFNSTDYDPDHGHFGGFDIPSADEFNVKGTFIIEGYEWPEGMNNSGLVIDLGELLENFFQYEIPPHGGYVTKGDDNPGIDQTSMFYNADPPVIEPVKEEWIIGVYSNKLQKDPQAWVCCIASIIPVLLFLGTIVTFSMDMVRETRKKNTENK